VARNPAAKPNPAQVAQEQADCFRLKLNGCSVREIAAELGMAASTVQNRLQAAYDDLVLPAADEVRQLELARLDSWHRKLEARLDEALEPEKVVPALLRCQERRSKYLGLDAPERQEITTTVLPAADDAVEVLLAQGRAAYGAE
jgi:DNA-binding transcriptional ArsR family regulator